MDKQEWIARALLILMRMMLSLMKRTAPRAADDFKIEVVNSRSEYEVAFDQKLGRPRDLYGDT